METIDLYRPCSESNPFRGYWTVSRFDALFGVVEDREPWVDFAIHTVEWEAREFARRLAETGDLRVREILE